MVFLFFLLFCSHIPHKDVMHKTYNIEHTCIMYGYRLVRLVKVFTTDKHKQLNCSEPRLVKRFTTYSRFY